MNILDIVIVLVLAAAVISGLRHGFVRQVARFIGFILGLIVAFRFSPDVAHAIKQLIAPESGSDASTGLIFLSMSDFVYRLIAFVLLFFMTRFGVRLVANLLHRVVSLPVLNMVNRVTGLLLALIQACIITIIIVNVLQFIPGPKMQSLLQNSIVATWIIDHTPTLTNWLTDWLNLSKS